MCMCACKMEIMECYRIYFTSHVAVSLSTTELHSLMVYSRLWSSFSFDLSMTEKKNQIMDEGSSFSTFPLRKGTADKGWSCTKHLCWSGITFQFFHDIVDVMVQIRADEPLVGRIRASLGVNRWNEWSLIEFLMIIMSSWRLYDTCVIGMSISWHSMLSRTSNRMSTTNEESQYVIAANRATWWLLSVKLQQ